MNPSETRTPAIRIEARVDSGTLLPGRAWCAERPRALIAIVHGIGEHSGRYAALAGALVERRYTVASLDLPGHGEAKGARGDVRGWEFLRDRCVPATFTATRGIPDQPGDPPVVLLGHSLGGLLTLDYALAHPRTIRAAVASAPALRGEAPPAWKLALAQVARLLAPSHGFPNGIDESGISRDAEVLRLRAADPLVHDRVSPRLYFGFDEARTRALREARRLSLPVLLLQGMADRVVDPRGAVEFNAHAPHGLSRLVTYPDAYHEVFNDLDRAQVIADLLGWLDALRLG